MIRLSRLALALGSLSTVATAAVTITEADYEGRAQFKVETASATYWYDRAGGGFSRLFDPDGEDWISFRKDPLKGGLAPAAAGYRGIPNLLHGANNPDAGAGHPGFDLCESIVAGADMIRTVSRSGRWAWSWRFTDERATLTIEQADPGQAYWFLYEGTIGGRWSPLTHTWGTDAGGPRRDTPDSGRQVFDRWRWVYFGDEAAPRVLLLAQHGADDAPDTMWYMGSTADRLRAADGMAVFGFGRGPGTAPQLRGAGHRFTLGFVPGPARDAAAHARIASVAESWIQKAAPGVEVPPGFSVETLATGLNAATAFALAPDGRIFIADQTGPLRVWKNGTLLPRPALDLSDRLDTWWERGLVGLTLHPDFPRTPQVFALYVAKSPHTHHVLSRFTLSGDIVDPASEHILLEGEDQKLFGGPQPAGHQGGPLRFGPDGRLYISLGEQTAGQPAQSRQHFQGKILRLNADGSIPPDNPFYGETTGAYRAIWALGLRNTFGLAFQPGTGRLFSTDVGQTGWEEVNVIVRGANYGWPLAEGRSDNPAWTNPLHAYPPAIGRSIVGAAFHPRVPMGGTGFPAAWRGKFFFADWAANWIKALDPENPADIVTLARGLNGPVALEFTPDGSLLVLNRGTIWRDGKKWQPASGSLVRIRYTGERPEAPPSAAHARTLAATGVFTRIAPLTPRDGLVEFQVAAAPWLPGVSTRRWIAVPVGARLLVNVEGEFEFPSGTVVVQHHSVARTRAALETHVYTFFGDSNHSRMARAAAYRWREPGADAALVDESALLPLPDDPSGRWLSPAAEPQVNLDAAVAGFLLPLSPRQLDAKQLELWRTRGWLAPRSPAPGFTRLAAWDDAGVPLELRVRSYLHVNCAQCHRPGGTGRGSFDARFVTPLAAQKLLDGELLAGDLGVPGARLVVPGQPDRSMLHLRLLRTDALRMPPVALSDEPAPIVPVLAEWIRSLRSP